MKTLVYVFTTFLILETAGRLLFLHMDDYPREVGRSSDLLGIALNIPLLCWAILVLLGG